MDVDWAVGELRNFVEKTQLVHVPDPPGMTIFADTRRTAAGKDQIVPALQVVEQILARVLPDWRVAVPTDDSGRWMQEREAAQRAIAQLERQAEIDEKLGANAPRLSASSMHPWIWEGAQSLWQSGHYREAVRAASAKLNAEAQNKLGRRDVSETTLFQQAYSADGPKPGQPRLRLPDDDGGRTALSERRGIAALAEGCFAALRNPASHDPGELDETVALEQLAAFSLVARYVDRSRLQT
jgi:hypothetical protein